MKSAKYIAAVIFFLPLVLFGQSGGPALVSPEELKPKDLNSAAGQGDDKFFVATPTVSWEVSTYQDGVVFSGRIKPGWKMYDTGPYDGPTALSFDFAQAENITLKGVPTALTQADVGYSPEFETEIGSFADSVRYSQRLAVGVKPAGVLVKIEWMSCDTVGRCLPAENTAFRIKFVRDNETSPIQMEAKEIAVEEFEAAAYRTDFVGRRSMWRNILAAMAWGLLALLTPCVFPMIPLTVSYFVRAQPSRAAAGRRASLYGIFIIALYTLPIAALVLATRLAGGAAVTADIFNWLSTHWLPNVVFFLVFMLFAAALLGAFEFRLPARLITRVDRGADRAGSIGIFFMALTLVLVSFSCTGPIIGNALIESTSGGSLWAPVVTMFAFSTVFAIPFAFFAFFPSLLSRLPGSGGWLNTVKICLGFIEIALGLKFLSVADQTYHWGILGREVYVAIWIAVFIAIGGYLLGIIRLHVDKRDDGCDDGRDDGRTDKHRYRHGGIKNVGAGRIIAAVAAFSFAAYLIPGLFGAPLKAISGYLPPMQSEHAYASAENLFFDLDLAQEYADDVGKPLIVNITGHGCVNCREMEARVLSDPRISTLLREKYVVAELFLDDKKQLPERQWITTPEGRPLKNQGRINSDLVMRRYGVNAQPCYILQGRGGKIIAPYYGYDLNVERFVDFLETGLRAYR